MRVDSCLIPPGLIAGAKMYSLLLEGDTLYVICTGNGPASILEYTRGLQKVRQSGGLLDNAVVTAVVNGCLKNIQAAEAQINAGNAAEWAARKGNFAFAKPEIQAFKLDDRQTWLRLELVTARKKLKFDCTILERDRLQALAAALGRG